MPARAPSLFELQQALRRSVLDGVHDDAAACILADGLATAERLGIYRNSAATVLVTALRLAFPAVHQLVGAQCFEGAARLFAAEAPPLSAWLDEYGAAFPAFLARQEALQALPYLIDVARLEWQINLVLHACDGPALDVARLAQLNEDQLQQLRFVPRPATSLYRSAFPVDAIWRAVLERDEPAMRRIDLADGPVRLLICRDESGLDVLRLDEKEWRFTVALWSGKPLRLVCEDAGFDQAYALLAAHLAHGRLAEAFTRQGDPPDTARPLFPGSEA